MVSYKLLGGITPNYNCVAFGDAGELTDFGFKRSKVKVTTRPVMLKKFTFESYFVIIVH